MRIPLVRANDGEMTGAGLSALLASASAGDQAAWESLVRLYARRVYALARSRCGNHDVAEEITQSVFVTVATKLQNGGYAEQGRFEAWIFRVAMNRVRDVIRRAKSRRTTSESDLESAPAPAPVVARADAENLAALRGAVAELSEADREIIELRHNAGMGFKEIAELLEEPMGTLLARHHRALRKLRDSLAARGYAAMNGEGEA